LAAYIFRAGFFWIVAMREKVVSCVTDDSEILSHSRDSIVRNQQLLLSPTRPTLSAEKQSFHAPSIKIDEAGKTGRR